MSFSEHIIDFCYYCKPFAIELAGVLLCFVLARRKEYAERCESVLKVLLSILLLHLSLFHISGYGLNAIGYNAVAAVMALYGLFLIIYKKIDSEKKIIWIFGVVVAICNFSASNQYAFVVTEALLISSFATLYMFTWHGPVSINKSSLIIIGCQVFSLIYVFTGHVYWEDGLNSLTYKITDGPMKGINCTQEEYDKYYSYLSDFNEIKKDDSDLPVLFYQNIPWAYMYTDTEVGCFSTWGEAIDTLDNQLSLDYYELYPQKTPNLIYVDNTTFSADTTFFYQYANAHGYTLKLLDSGAIILES
jgi:hypothetical protein